jgi:hypothetical protein
MVEKMIPDLANAVDRKSIWTQNDLKYAYRATFARSPRDEDVNVEVLEYLGQRQIQKSYCHGYYMADLWKVIFFSIGDWVPKKPRLGLMDIPIGDLVLNPERTPESLVGSKGTLRFWRTLAVHFDDESGEGGDF